MFSHSSSTTVRTAWSVTCSGLKHLNNNWMDCRAISSSLLFVFLQEIPFVSVATVRPMQQQKIAQLETDIRQHVLHHNITNHHKIK